MPKNKRKGQKPKNQNEQPTGRVRKGRAARIKKQELWAEEAKERAAQKELEASLLTSASASNGSDDQKQQVISEPYVVEHKGIESPAGFSVEIEGGSGPEDFPVGDSLVEENKVSNEIDVDVVSKPEDIEVEIQKTLVKDHLLAPENSQPAAAVTFHAGRSQQPGSAVVVPAVAQPSSVVAQAPLSPEVKGEQTELKNLLGEIRPPIMQALILARFEGSPLKETKIDVDNFRKELAIFRDKQANSRLAISGSEQRKILADFLEKGCGVPGPLINKSQNDYMADAIFSALEKNRTQLSLYNIQKLSAPIVDHFLEHPVTKDILITPLSKESGIIEDLVKQRLADVLIKKIETFKSDIELNAYLKELDDPLYLRRRVPEYLKFIGIDLATLGVPKDQQSKVMLAIETTWSDMANSYGLRQERAPLIGIEHLVLSHIIASGHVQEYDTKKGKQTTLRFFLKDFIKGLDEKIIAVLKEVKLLDKPVSRDEFIKAKNALENAIANIRSAIAEENKPAVTDEDKKNRALAAERIRFSDDKESSGIFNFNRSPEVKMVQEFIENIFPNDKLIARSCAFKVISSLITDQRALQEYIVVRDEGLNTEYNDKFITTSTGVNKTIAARWEEIVNNFLIDPRVEAIFAPLQEMRQEIFNALLEKISKLDGADLQSHLQNIKDLSYLKEIKGDPRKVNQALNKLGIGLTKLGVSKDQQSNVIADIAKVITNLDTELNPKAPGPITSSVVPMPSSDKPMVDIFDSPPIDDVSSDERKRESKESLLVSQQFDSSSTDSLDLQGVGSGLDAGEVKRPIRADPVTADSIIQPVTLSAPTVPLSQPAIQLPIDPPLADFALPTGGDSKRSTAVDLQIPAAVNVAQPLLPAEHKPQIVVQPQSPDRKAELSNLLWGNSIEPKVLKEAILQGFTFGGMTGEARKALGRDVSENQFKSALATFHQSILQREIERQDKGGHLQELITQEILEKFLKDGCNVKDVHVGVAQTALGAFEEAKPSAYEARIHAVAAADRVFTNKNILKLLQPLIEKNGIRDEKALDKHRQNFIKNLSSLNVKQRVERLQYLGDLTATSQLGQDINKVLDNRTELEKLLIKNLGVSKSLWETLPDMTKSAATVFPANELKAPSIAGVDSIGSNAVKDTVTKAGVDPLLTSETKRSHVPASEIKGTSLSAASLGGKLTLADMLNKIRTPGLADIIKSEIIKSWGKQAQALSGSEDNIYQAINVFNEDLRTVRVSKDRAILQLLQTAYKGTAISGFTSSTFEVMARHIADKYDAGSIKTQTYNSRYNQYSSAVNHELGDETSLVSFVFSSMLADPITKARFAHDLIDQCVKENKNILLDEKSLIEKLSSAKNLPDFEAKLKEFGIKASDYNSEAITQLWHRALFSRYAKTTEISLGEPLGVLARLIRDNDIKLPGQPEHGVFFSKLITALKGDSKVEVEKALALFGVNDVMQKQQVIHGWVLDRLKFDDKRRSPLLAALREPEMISYLAMSREPIQAIKEIKDIADKMGNGVVVDARFNADLWQKLNLTTMPQLQIHLKAVIRAENLLNDPVIKDGMKNQAQSQPRLVALLKEKLSKPSDILASFDFAGLQSNIAQLFATTSTLPERQQIAILINIGATQEEMTQIYGELYADRFLKEVAKIDRDYADILGLEGNYEALINLMGKYDLDGVNFGNFLEAVRQDLVDPSKAIEFVGKQGLVGKQGQDGSDSYKSYMLKQQCLVAALVNHANIAEAKGGFVIPAVVYPYISSHKDKFVTALANNLEFKAAVSKIIEAKPGTDEAKAAAGQDTNIVVKLCDEYRTSKDIIAASQAGAKIGASGTDIYVEVHQAARLAQLKVLCTDPKDNKPPSWTERDIEIEAKKGKNNKLLHVMIGVERCTSILEDKNIPDPQKDAFRKAITNAGHSAPGAVDQTITLFESIGKAKTLEEISKICLSQRYNSGHSAQDIMPAVEHQIYAESRYQQLVERLSSPGYSALKDVVIKKRDELILKLRNPQFNDKDLAKIMDSLAAYIPAGDVVTSTENFLEHLKDLKSPALREFLEHYTTELPKGDKIDLIALISGMNSIITQSPLNPDSVKSALRSDCLKMAPNAARVFDGVVKQQLALEIASRQQLAIALGAIDKTSGPPVLSKETLLDVLMKNIPLKDADEAKKLGEAILPLLNSGCDSEKLKQVLNTALGGVAAVKEISLKAITEMTTAINWVDRQPTSQQKQALELGAKDDVSGSVNALLSEIKTHYPYEDYNNIDAGKIDDVTKSYLRDDLQAVQTVQKHLAEYETKLEIYLANVEVAGVLINSSEVDQLRESLIIAKANLKECHDALKEADQEPALTLDMPADQSVLLDDTLAKEFLASEKKTDFQVEYKAAEAFILKSNANVKFQSGGSVKPDPTVNTVLSASRIPSSTGGKPVPINKGQVVAVLHKCKDGTTSPYYATQDKFIFGKVPKDGTDAMHKAMKIALDFFNSQAGKALPIVAHMRADSNAKDAAMLVAAIKIISHRRGIPVQFPDQVVKSLESHYKIGDPANPEPKFESLVAKMSAEMNRKEFAATPLGKAYAYHAPDPNKHVADIKKSVDKVTEGVKILTSSKLPQLPLTPPRIPTLSMGGRSSS